MALLSLAILVVPSLSGCSNASLVEVADARTPVPASEQAAAVYLTITNDGSADDRLLSVASDLARSVMVHRTVISNGTAMMHPAGPVDVPAGSTVVFEPGGLHVMLAGLETVPAEGNMFTVELTFEKAGVVPVEVRVVPTGEVTG